MNIFPYRWVAKIIAFIALFALFSFGGFLTTSPEFSPNLYDTLALNGIAGVYCLFAMPLACCFAAVASTEAGTSFARMLHKAAVAIAVPGVLLLGLSTGIPALKPIVYYALCVVWFAATFALICASINDHYQRLKSSDGNLDTAN